MTKKVLSLIRHICLIWLIIYLIISIFKFIKINIRINEKYGIVSKKFFVVGYTNESIVIDNILLLLDRTVFPHFNPFYRYAVPEKMSTNIVFKTSFMDGKFSVTMNDGIITRDNFYEVLLYDKKFQHLYSEWLKKQIGLKDENVGFELEYGEIDFSKIKTLNDTFDEVFENCDYTLRSINIKNINEKDKYKIFNEYREKYYEKLDKDFENKFIVCFDEENDIWIKDYIKIGKKNYYLQDVGLNDNKTIHILSKYEQLDNVFNNIDVIKKLLDEMIPKKIHESSSLIESDSNKIYAGSVLRLDLSDVVMRKYILDVKYYDNNIDGNNKLILVNPKYVRYTIVVDAERFSIVEHKEIHQYEYIGKQDKYKEEQIKDRIQVDGERWFYSLKLTGQTDDEKVNEVISKKLRETTEEFINNNINAPQMVANRIYKKNLFNVFLQTGDYILIESRILDGYLILDLQEYKFIENKIIAEDDTYMMHEFDDKIFLAYKKPNKDSFIDYMVLERVQNMIKIKFYAEKFVPQTKSVKDNWHNYIVNTNNKTMEEVIAEK